MGACLVVLISNVSENQAGGGTEDSFKVSWDGWKVNWIGFGDVLDTREDHGLNANTESEMGLLQNQA